MTTLACATHWYVSGLFTVPTVLVGGWSWWSSRHGETSGEAGESLHGGEDSLEPVDSRRS